MENNWIFINLQLPPQNVVVEMKVDDKHGKRQIQKLKRISNLWWLPDGTMYVYYTPTHWRFI